MTQDSTYQIPAIILSRRDWREYDRLYTVLTPEGKKDIRAIGCRRPKSKLVGRIEPWMETSLLLVRGRTFDIVADSQPRERWPILHSAFPAYFFGSWLADFTDKLLPLGEPNPEVCEIVHSAFETLAALALVNQLEGKASKTEWRDWWLKHTAELLDHAGLSHPDLATTKDIDAWYWYLSASLDRPLPTFTLIRSLL